MTDVTTTANVTPADAPAVVAAVPAWTPRVQHGVKEYRPGTTGARVWAIADAITARKGAWASAAEVVAEGGEQGIVPGSARAGYATWRGFNGLKGHRVADPSKEQAAAEKAAAAEAKKAEAEAKRVEKEKAAAAKAAEKAAAAEAKAAQKAELAAQKAAQKLADAEAKAAAKAAADTGADVPPPPPAE